MEVGLQVQPSLIVIPEVLPFVFELALQELVLLPVVFGVSQSEVRGARVGHRDLVHRDRGLLLPLPFVTVVLDSLLAVDLLHLHGGKILGKSWRI